MTNRYAKTGINKKCLICNKKFYVMPYDIENRKFCSRKCFYQGKSKNGCFQKGHKDLVTADGRKSQSEKMKGHKYSLGKNIGILNWRWIKDRTRLKKSEKKHLDGQYIDWMKSVKNRDKWKCKINNKDCSGKLEAHHILPWSKFPELRYEINNGISLCHFHHPRKRNDEIKLVSFFKGLIQ